MGITFAGAAAAMALCLDAQTLTVYVKDSAPVKPADLTRAMEKAAELLRPAGVQIQWRHGEPSCRDQDFPRPILVHVVPGIPSYRHLGTLAFAQAYEGVHVTILYDRVSQIMPGSTQVVLGYTLAHEITHLLQGISRHSDSGVMKRVWNRADCFEMRCGRLVLSAEDIDLIHQGLNHWELIHRGLIRSDGDRALAAGLSHPLLQ